MSESYIKVSDLFEVKNGYAFKSSEQLVLNISGSKEILKQGHIELGGGLRKFPKSSYVQMNSRLEKYMLEKGDIVLAMTDMKDNVALLGMPALIRESNKYVLNQRVGLLKPKKNTYSVFYYYQMLTPLFIQTLQSKANSGVQVNLSTSAIKDMTLWSPTLQEQIAIAEVLSSLDDKIDLLHRQNKTLEQMAETLFRQWFIEVENLNTTQILKISDIAEMQNGYSFKSSEFIEEQEDTIEVMKMGHISPSGGLKSSPKKDFVKRSEKLKKWTLNKRDIVLCMTDMKDNVVVLGVPALVDKDDKYVLNQRVGRIHLKQKSPILDILILYMQMKESTFINLLQSKANSGVQVNLSSESIRESLIVVPEIDKQMYIIPIISGFYDKIDLNRIQINQLKKMCDTLLPKLMSGEVRVKMD